MVNRALNQNRRNPMVIPRTLLQNTYCPPRKKLHIAADRAGPPTQTFRPDPRGLEPLADPPSFEPIEIDMNDITKIFSTLIALMALAGASGSLHADTITVCPDGTCDFTSVDEAITAAADGDRIEIGSGVYDLSQSHDLEERRIEVVGVAEASKAPAACARMERHVNSCLDGRRVDHRTGRNAGNLPRRPDVRRGGAGSSG